jgi:hypothetical protein
MPNTKDFIPVTRVEQDTVILNDGSVAMVLQTSAVNFDLLSQQEQLAIIGSFAAFLNSLSFSIQILIRSKKLDISHYLSTLKEAERKQHNPLLQLMMQHYRAFVAAIIRDNEVLDKQFFVIFAVSPIELGVVKTTDEKTLQKAITILNPRRDHILKQLSRIGLKSSQLDDERLIRLFYDIYNDEDKITLSDIQANPANQTPANVPTKFEYGTANQHTASSGQGTVKNSMNSPITEPSTLNPVPSTPPSSPSVPPPPQPVARPAAPAPQPIPQNIPQVMPPPTQQITPPPPPQSKTPPSTAPSPTLYSSPQTANPFVVEELPG